MNVVTYGIMLHAWFNSDLHTKIVYSHSHIDAFVSRFEIDYPYNYPRIFQTEPNTCVPTTIKIVLEMMRHKIDGIPDLSVDQIAKIVGTQEDGTPLGYNIERINEHLKLTNPFLDFKVEFLIPEWQIICDDINEMNPFRKSVILLIMQYDSHELNWFQHAVVLIEANNDYVTYFDPIYGDMAEPTNKIYHQWEMNDRLCIRLKIGERVQRILEEYQESEEEVA